MSTDRAGRPSEPRAPHRREPELEIRVVVIDEAFRSPEVGTAVTSQSAELRGRSLTDLTRSADRPTTSLILVD